jgi:hypothetical protein
VLGNAAYSGLSAAVSRLWQRSSARNGAAPAPAPGPAPAPAAERHTAREAFDAACLAIREHCTAIEVPVPDFATMSCDYHTSDDRWVFVFRERDHRRRFQVSVRPPRQDGRTVVMMSASGWHR